MLAGREGRLDDRILGEDSRPCPEPKPVSARVPIVIIAEGEGNFFHSPPMFRMSCS